MKKLPIYIICGPTATGKTARSLELAREIGGEIISADSRQVYRDLNIGTAKITKDEMDGIPHHMIDIVDPQDYYSAALFKEASERCINDIHKRGAIPIIVGGTGFYIDTLIYDQSLPLVPPQEHIRARYQDTPTEDLYKILSHQDPVSSEKIDRHNRVRIVRALEIFETLGHIPQKPEKKLLYDIHWEYIDRDNDDLKKRIHDRNITRVHGGLVDEVQGLLDQGISPERLHAFGLEYRYTLLYIQGLIKNKEELVTILDTKTWQFAKRQRTWFKKFLPQEVFRSL
ncbi:MAG: tRNA (adenosine(37)-N6)-dimethylallyltransferase MiaA [Candidatus Pacebacteria bacterium]|nr:tRNA (adenosine(37)-N6)-dimethylallyltransferase MiaA [Candidatus Paceibacterota bacterium]MCD8563566.1 tRNA (adenosine(37)-N6)-dimethylallyltransferase MiaA [Candidatus Paceibacterota bacterium]